MHGGLKPTNILTEHTGTVKIVNMGINQLLKGQRETPIITAYLAPEQLVDITVNAQVDQYALAVLFYELISGKFPFESSFERNDRDTNIQKILHEVPPRLSELSDAQWSILCTALTKDPLARHDSCQSFINQLAAASGIKQVSTQKKKVVNNYKRKKRRSQLIATVRKTAYYACFATVIYYGYKNYDNIIGKFSRDKKIGFSSTSNNPLYRQRRNPAAPPKNIISQYIDKSMDYAGSKFTQPTKQHEVDTASQYRTAAENFKQAEGDMVRGQARQSLNLFKSTKTQLKNIRSQTTTAWRVSALERKIEECEDNIDALEKYLRIKPVVE